MADVGGLYVPEMRALAGKAARGAGLERALRKRPDGLRRCCTLGGKMAQVFWRVCWWGGGAAHLYRLLQVNGALMRPTCRFARCMLWWRLWIFVGWIRA